MTGAAPSAATPRVPLTRRLGRGPHSPQLSPRVAGAASAAYLANPEPDKPYEDAFLCGPDFFCIADGVTRARDRAGKYPSPSPAAAAAWTAIHAAAEVMSSSSAGPPALETAFRLANEAIAAHKFAESDLPGAVMTIAALSNAYLYYGHLGDGRLMVRQPDGRLRRLTTVQTRGADAWVEKRIRAGADPASTRLAARSDMRNRPGHPHAFGVLDGDPRALPFVEYGRFPLARVQQILLATDGIGLYLEHCLRDDAAQARLLRAMDRGEALAILNAATRWNAAQRIRQDDKTLLLMRWRMPE